MEGKWTAYVADTGSFIYTFKKVKDYETVSLLVQVDGHWERIGKFTRKDGNVEYTEIKNFKKITVNTQEEIPSITVGKYQTKKRTLKFRGDSETTESNPMEIRINFEEKPLFSPPEPEKPKEGKSMKFDCKGENMKNLKYTIDNTIVEEDVIANRDYHKKEALCYVDYKSDSNLDEDILEGYNIIKSDPFVLEILFTPNKQIITIDENYCENPNKNVVNLTCNEDKEHPTNPSINKWSWKQNEEELQRTLQSETFTVIELEKGPLTCTAENNIGKGEPSDTFKSAQLCTNKATMPLVLGGGICVVILVIIASFILFRRRRKGASKDDEINMDGHSPYQYEPAAPTIGPPSSSGSEGASLVDHSDSRYKPKFDYDPKGNSSAGQYQSLDHASLGLRKNQTPIGTKDKVDYVEFSSSGK